MKIIIRFLLLTVVSVTLCRISVGQNVILVQNHESGIYKKGEKIRVTLFLKGVSSDSVIIKVRKNYSDKVSQQNLKFQGDTLLIFEETINEPASVIFEAATKDEMVSTGLVVEPGQFKPGTARPKDFDHFWATEKKALRSLPLNVKTVAVGEVTPGFTCNELEITCTGPKPVRGYFAKPALAKDKSLPIILVVHAAGVKGSWCRSEPGNALRYAGMGQGALCFDLNAHGMLNGQSEEYYQDLENGELKGYNLQGVESRETFYFRGMYLRLIRTLDFLASQPAWDGKRILVIGESQGGGQALAAAGLDKRVSAVVATVPAMCDWGGALAGRRGGWPQPFENSHDRDKLLLSVPYFDTAHLLKGSKATILTEIGLIDNTCPSTSVYAAINQAKGEKIIYAVPYRPHHAPSDYRKEVWNRTVNQPREEFVRRYLQ